MGGDYGRGGRSSSTTRGCRSPVNRIRSVDSRRTVPAQRSAILFASGACGGVRMTLIPAALNTASNTALTCCLDRAAGTAADRLAGQASPWDDRAGLCGWAKGGVVAVFVNRELELKILAGLVDRAAHGAGAVLCVQGQPGIGKTALLDAAAKVAGPAGAVMYRVSCHAQVGEFQSYGPFLALLTQIDQGGPRSRFRRFGGQAARSAGPELLNLVPGLGPLLKSAAEVVVGAVPGAPTVDPMAAAHLVTDAVLRAVRKARSAVIVVDDAHRIDASSCAVLSYLAEAVSDRPLLIVLLLRDQHDNVVLKNLIDELYVRDRLRKIHLRGLETAAVAELSRRLTGHPLDLRRARELTEQTAGHPLILRLHLGERTDRIALPASDSRLPEATSRDPAVHSTRDQLTTLVRMRLDHLNGALAAVSAEEILIHHAIILRECGETNAAKNIARRAAAEVRRKASSLPDNQRERFLHDLPVNCLVAETLSSLSHHGVQAGSAARRTAPSD